MSEEPAADLVDALAGVIGEFRPAGRKRRLASAKVARELAAALAALWAPGETPPVVPAVMRDLADLEERQTGISKSGLAAAALAMARELDNEGNTASGMASCAGRLDELLAELRLMARRRTPDHPADPKPGDGLDDLTARRAARRTAS